MTDELDIIDDSSVGNQFFIDGKAHTIDDYLHGVNDVLSEIESTGDFEIGANTLYSMSNVGHAIGISKAKLLHGMWLLWEKSGKDFDSYCQYVIDFGHLSSKVIISRYIDAWRVVLKAPPALMDDLVLHPMKNLNALGAAISQGFELNEDTWDKLIDAHDNNQFLKIIREDVKNQPARKNSLVIYLEENGDLVAWQDGNTKIIGYLDIDGAEKSEVASKGIQRILKCAGIIER